MTHWMIWLVLAGALVILEMFSGTFYLLMVAIGMLAGAAMALAGSPLELQLIVAAVVGMIATAVLRRTRFGKSSRTDPARDPNVNLDIGQSINIDTWNPPPPPGARATARVMYRGALWDVELAHDGVAPPGQYRIREMQGSRLIVDKSH
jgi:membrane protein implicated in regulation of membrane protease activity